MAKEKGIGPVRVKAFGKRLVPIIQPPGTGLLDTFLSELERTDCQETADGLFFKMAQVRLLSWEEIFQRLRIYVAYANAGNKQARVCLTHHILENLTLCEFGSRKVETGSLRAEEWSELQIRAIKELLGYLRRDIKSVICQEPYRRIVREFLEKLFMGTKNLTIGRIALDVFLKYRYRIDLDVYECNSLEHMLITLRDLVNTEENEAFLEAIDAAFEKRMELETYDGLIHRKILEAKIATYLFLWELERVKKEKQVRAVADICG